MKISALLLSSWGIDFLRERPDVVIAGSPERTDFRVVIEDRRGDLFIVEAVAPGIRVRKHRIATILAQLNARGVAGVTPYQVTAAGDFFVFSQEKYWQVVPYVPGLALDRPAYVFDSWRGEAAAEFLLRLRKSAVDLSQPVFSLPTYIDGLVESIRKNRPDVLPNVETMHAFVRKRLYPVYDRLPVCFCHGDYHAINIVWNANGIAAVIDWEFCGVKPELYDAANMVSCLGIEDPECLWAGAPVAFLDRLRASGQYAGISFEYFTDLMIAFRFAWLSEWLRKDDDDMLRMEFDYFDILAALSRTGG